jgi:hypothetical protein
MAQFKATMITATSREFSVTVDAINRADAVDAACERHPDCMLGDIESVGITPIPPSFLFPSHIGALGF